MTQQNGAVTIVKEKKGEAPDASEAAEKVNRILNDDWNGKSAEVKISAKETKPKITEKQLEEVTDLLGTHTTFYGADGTGRSQNVETGADASQWDSDTAGGRGFCK